jgi:hypothetical protein
MYEFILVNLYTKISEKKDLHPVGISTRDNIRAWNRRALPSTTSPPPSVAIFFIRQADRGFATSRLCTDEDGTILVHILHGSDWYIKKGGERSAGYG